MINVDHIRNGNDHALTDDLVAGTTIFPAASAWAGKRRSRQDAKKSIDTPILQKIA